MADHGEQIGEVVTTIPTIGFNVEYAPLLLSFRFRLYGKKERKKERKK